MVNSTGHPQVQIDIQPALFPASSKSTSSKSGSASTRVSTISFTDRLLIVISQSGALSHWVHVPLSSVSADPMNPSFTLTDGGNENSLLPRSELTATTVFGGTRRDDEIMGHTLATTIASAILLKTPGEQRLLVLGLGLTNMESMGRPEFEEEVRSAVRPEKDSLEILGRNNDKAPGSLLSHLVKGKGECCQKVLAWKCCTRQTSRARPTRDIIYGNRHASESFVNFLTITLTLTVTAIATATRTHKA
nr:hypothetical protein CFP56_73100 [Quercus suber]